MVKRRIWDWARGRARQSHDFATSNTKLLIFVFILFYYDNMLNDPIVRS